MIQTDIGKSLRPVLALAPVSITAGGAGDGVAQNGPAIDRQGYMSAVLVVPAIATLAQGATLTLSALLQDSPDGQAGWANYAVAQNLVLTGGAGGSTERGQLELNVDLRGARRYVRAQITGDLSAAGVDTAMFAASLILGGSDKEPV